MEASVGKVYFRMFSIVLHIYQVEGLSEEDRETVKLFANNRWQMMHTDMHSAGFVLDPEYNFEAYSQQPMEKLCPDFVTL